MLCGFLCHNCFALIFFSFLKGLGTKFCGWLIQLFKDFMIFTLWHCFIYCLLVCRSVCLLFSSFCRFRRWPWFFSFFISDFFFKSFYTQLTSFCDCVFHGRFATASSRKCPFIRTNFYFLSNSLSRSHWLCFDRSWPEPQFWCCNCFLRHCLFGFICISVKACFLLRLWFLFCNFFFH